MSDEPVTTKRALIQFRATEADEEAWTRHAERRGLSLSAFLRIAANAEMQRAELYPTSAHAAAVTQERVREMPGDSPLHGPIMREAARHAPRQVIPTIERSTRRPEVEQVSFANVEHDHVIVYDE